MACCQVVTDAYTSLFALYSCVVNWILDKIGVKSEDEVLNKSLRVLFVCCMFLFFKGITQSVWCFLEVWLWFGIFNIVMSFVLPLYCYIFCTNRTLCMCISFILLSVTCLGVVVAGLVQKSIWIGLYFAGEPPDNYVPTTLKYVTMFFHVLLIIALITIVYHAVKVSRLLFVISSSKSKLSNKPRGYLTDSEIVKAARCDEVNC